MVTSRAPAGKKTATDSGAKKPASKKAGAATAASKKTVANKAGVSKPAAKKAAAKTSPVATPPKNTAAKEVAAKKTSKPLLPRNVAAKSKTGGESVQKRSVSPEERYQMIAAAAYLLAERRNFAAGGELDDWVAAEAEVDARLGL